MKVEPFDTQRQMTFTRRATLVTGGVTALFGGIVYRLWDLQVKRYDEFAAKADNNRFKQRIVVPGRGDIVDRYGKVLATNRQNFRILLIPEEAENERTALVNLAALIPLSDEEIKAALREVERTRNQPFVPITVRDDVTWEQYAAVNYHSSRLKGISSEVGESRYYPDGEVVAPFLGHVGAATAQDLAGVSERTERLLYLQPGFRLGKNGLERSYDEVLRGEAGSQTIEVTAAGRVLAEEDERGRPQVPGKVLALTIDDEIQAKAMEIMSADYEEYPEGTERPSAASGAAVVLDIVTGDILALASTPAFDPNLFATDVDPATLRELSTSPQNPLISKPVSGVYPPGSTFKAITAIAALEAGISPTTRFRCPGYYYYGGQRFRCWKREGHGSVDLVGSLQHSCDVYYYNMGARLGIDQIADVAQRFGLGQTFDIGLQNEKSGIVPSTEWKRTRYRTNPANQTWFPGETLSVAIGQGATTATPLQLAVMSARIASGKRVMPRIVRGVATDSVPVQDFEDIGVEASHLAAVRDGLDAVVNRWGTAARSRLLPDYRMAGKTGTSQVRSLRINPQTGQPFSNYQLPWNERDHALFIAFAPVESPRYAISVVVEHGGSGSRSAAPRARDLMRAVLDKDPGNPSKHDLYEPGAVIQRRMAGLRET
ncbi:Cell division protein FtsI [Parvularcula bermudensis HTCC2503]|uniref:Cell division protein FtsI n=1 Tax=Parvularcula bermudensis (strain ATCC BAA-594 / HTCC2503 / KCTC 12087) TaxID=314260 RepID=E0TB78_PARBH|nr:penicillin-binding protein 2 [Parvularcula bermudensis]ADM08282.1 Cell division protein FtsI [Parvularcula bermudensis HTCC2503]